MEKHKRKKLMGVRELAEIIGVPTSWIYERTASQKIPYLKIGKYVRFDVDEVLEFFKNQGKSAG